MIFDIRDEDWDVPIRGKEADGTKIDPVVGAIRILMLALIALDDPRVDSVLGKAGVKVVNQKGAQLFPVDDRAIRLGKN